MKDLKELKKSHNDLARDEMLQIAGDLKRHLILQTPGIPWLEEATESIPKRDTLEHATTLEEVRAILGDCTRCRLHEGRNKIVFGQGNPRARLMFIGEGPGADEDRQGLAFVGKAGQLLTKIISAIGLTREEVYIANIVKCRPPGNRDPQEDEIRECIPFLQAQIRVIQPRIICTLGAPASKTLLNTTAPISRLRGHFHELDGVQVMPTYHPAYLLRNPEQKRPVWEDMQKVQALYRQ